MLRISILTDASDTTIRLEGKLLGPWCDEVARAIADAAKVRRPVRLDLYDADFVDDAGVALLRSLSQSGNVTVTRCSNFVAELLQMERI